MTLARQCHNAFNTQTKTTSVKTLALPLGGLQFKRGTPVHWEFPDGSTLVVTGRGKSHKMEVRDE